ncbi:mitochondrial protein [Rhizoctonia solani]|uniref:Mitochondrial protein n=1 Tax=Rhizoctonia solani TaxID=456999 RepID=A0A0K6FW40_9AGAM|nr:mitochondrial protein [Rhizoctonia solani]
MPTSRRRQWVWVPKDAHSETRKHLPASKLEKGIVPTWTGRPEWTQDKPTGEWGMKCVDRWCLLPPYDITITEEQWKAYYDERSALDKINTVGSAESEAVIGEYLEENTWKVLRKAAEHIASAILTSALDDTERQKSIARTLLGSLYFMSVEGSAECDCEPEPRSVDTTTRLYSPFGLGTSIDFHYDYHYRMRLHEDERSSTLNAAYRDIAECDPDNPTKCAAEPEEPEEGDAEPIENFKVEDFLDGWSTMYVTKENIKKFEEPFLGTNGWISPRKLVDILMAAGTALLHRELDTEAGEHLQHKFDYYQGEKAGRGIFAEERRHLTELEKAEKELDKRDKTRENPEWTQEKPTGEWAAKCVDRWCLLAPYNTTITEEQWKAYYEERSALDRINTMDSDESAAIEGESLDESTWKVLRKAVEHIASAILASALDDVRRKKSIARTLLGSLYFMSVDGSSEGLSAPEPRNLDTTTRLYSPFGLGTSIDFHYNYHYRMRSYEDERDAMLNAAGREIGECDPDSPTKCAAEPELPEDSEGEGEGPIQVDNLKACTLFSGVQDMIDGWSTMYITEESVKSFEEPLFGTNGWISPRKLVDILMAAGTALFHGEVDTEAGEHLQHEFDYYQGEKSGKGIFVKERKQLTQLEKAQKAKDKEDPTRDFCVPERLLLLARYGD